MQGFVAPYLVGVFETGSTTSGRAKTPAPASDTAAAPTAAAAPATQSPQGRRRRRTKMTTPGRGYEYMDLDDDLGPDDAAQATHQHAASNRGAGTLGFAGTAIKGGGEQAAGLTTLATDEFSGAPTMPMMPNTWDHDRPEPTERRDAGTD